LEAKAPYLLLRKKKAKEKKKAYPLWRSPLIVGGCTTESSTPGPVLAWPIGGAAV
jgi:hypothetical protein